MLLSSYALHFARLCSASGRLAVMFFFLRFFLFTSASLVNNNKGLAHTNKMQTLLATKDSNLQMLFRRVLAVSRSQLHRSKFYVEVARFHGFVG